MRTLAACFVLTCVAVAPAAAPPASERDAPQPRLRLGTPLPHAAEARVFWPSLVLSPDRKRWAFHHVSDAVEVFDVATGRRLFRYHDKGKTVRPLAFSHDGQTLAANGHFEGELELLSLGPAARPKRRLCRHFHEIEAAAFLPGDGRIATYGQGRLCVCDVATGEVVREETLKASAASFSPDGRSLIAQSGAALVLIDVATGRRRRFALPDSENRVAHLSWSADGRLLAAAVAMRVIVYDTKSARILWRAASAKETPRLAFSPDARSLAVEVAGAARIHEVRSGRVVRALALDVRRSDSLSDLAYADAERLFVLDRAGLLRKWSLRTGQTTDAGVGHLARVAGVGFAPDGVKLASVDRNGRLIRWTARDGKRIDAMTVPEDLRGGWLCYLSLSADGGAAMLVWPSFSLRIDTLLDLRQRRVAWDQHSHWLGDGCGLLSPDGKWAATETGRTPTEFRAEIWRAGGEKWRTVTLPDPVRGGWLKLVAFAPEPQELLVPVRPPNGRLAVQAIDAETGRVRRSFLAGQVDQKVDALASSPDGRLVVLVSKGCVCIWERVSGQAIDRIAIPSPCFVAQVVVTNAGRVLIRCDRERSISRQIVWDARAGKAALAFPDFKVRSTLSADGRQLAVGEADSTISLYDVPAPPATKPPRLDEDERERHWADLSADAATAWLARRRLADAPPDALALLLKRLKPTPAKKLKGVADLDADDFDTREAASKALAVALAKGDRGVELALRGVVEKPPSLEASLRARRLLAQAKPVPFSADELRVIRAVGLLEQIASPDAKALLKRLAAGGPSLLADEARSALARLDRITES